MGKARWGGEGELDRGRRGMGRQGGGLGAGGGGEGGEGALRAVIQHTSGGRGGRGRACRAQAISFLDVALPGTCLLAPVAWHTAA